MAPSLSWLHHLKARELKAIANAIGVSPAGRKATLIDLLGTSLPTSVFARQNGHGNRTATPDASHDLKGYVDEGRRVSSILSIDMGIKNLAYCRIHPSATPVITEWERLNVLRKPESTQTDVEPETVIAKDAYDPLLYASHASAWLSTLIEHDPSAHVLIERQRFRSGGGFAVQEWTLKVNMFEAMLYAVLETLRREGRWRGSVQGVLPGRVAGFWLGSGESERMEKGGRAGRKRKVGKDKKSDMSALVSEWFQKGEDVVAVKERAVNTKVKFLARFESRGTLKKFGKMDDLADCLLQGMAALEWEENRTLICKKGAAALDMLRKHRLI